MTFRPTPADLEAARAKTLPDVLGPGLDVLFCGINPGLYSAAIGCHFGRPGNRFWKALQGAGFTPRVLAPAQQFELLALGCGLTNLVARASAVASELSADELVRGRRELERKVARWRPRRLAVLGVGAYRTAFARRKAPLGAQEELLAGARVWVLPNPSGLNAHYQLPRLIELFGELRADALADQRRDRR